MYKIAVMGDRDSILGFGALGLDVFPTEDPTEARHTLHKLAREEYAIIYMPSSWPPSSLRRSTAITTASPPPSS